MSWRSLTSYSNSKGDRWGNTSTSVNSSNTALKGPTPGTTSTNKFKKHQKSLLSPNNLSISSKTSCKVSKKMLTKATRQNSARNWRNRTRPCWTRSGAFCSFTTVRTESLTKNLKLSTVELRSTNLTGTCLPRLLAQSPACYCQKWTLRQRQTQQLASAHWDFPLFGTI